MSWLLVMPILMPFAAAVLTFPLRRAPVAGWVSLAAALAALSPAVLLVRAVMREGVVAGQMSAWPAPFGITLVADHLSAAMVLITAIIGVAVSLYALAEVGARAREGGFFSLLQMLLGGVSGAFLTGDLFNLYVWFEVLLISSFGLLVIGGGREAVDGAVKYVALNLISTAMFLCAAGLTYGVAGTLNMADLRAAMAAVDPGLATVIAVMFLFAFGLKAAVFPLFFWLPAAYHTPLFSVSAVFAGLLTKVGVYALIRMFTLVFVGDQGFTHQILLWTACLTMLSGVLGAAAQNDFRKILSFHIVSQIGYMVLGLALMTPLALAGAVFYLIHHIIVKANLFFIAGIAGRLSGGTDLARMGGLGRAAPLLAVLFLVPAFSLAGFPPLSGFWAKYLLVRAAIEEGLGLVTFVALLTGLLTIYSMTKIWEAAFHRPNPDPGSPTGAAPVVLPARAREMRARGLMLAPVVVLAVMTVVIGLWPQPFAAYARVAAAQLLDPSAYIAAVLPGGAP